MLNKNKVKKSETQELFNQPWKFLELIMTIGNLFLGIDNSHLDVWFCWTNRRHFNKTTVLGWYFLGICLSYQKHKELKDGIHSHWLSFQCSFLFCIWSHEKSVLTLERVYVAEHGALKYNFWKKKALLAYGVHASFLFVLWMWWEITHILWVLSTECIEFWMNDPFLNLPD